MNMKIPKCSPVGVMTQDSKPEIRASLSQQRVVIEEILDSADLNSDIMLTEEQVKRLKAVQYNIIQLRKAQKKNSVIIDMKKLIT